ncbi:MAG: bifunctional 4-hydroxy-2-oxoglutarate aldolase/2-dehydro-3-deoxy-phosphogluconate aldolase [Actinomycetota bacterium]|nr:bifunctional 4-hydroxy-2-oxoglutarate aldolase/2-dehydro-3-deoxy-phosphogluconate aldolase [Actinomycetota bacterium]
MRRAELPAAILDERVIPVARGMTRESAPVLASALRQGGLTVIEITVEGTAGIDAISSLKGSELTIGAGTIMSIGLAVAAVEAGAGFLVSPHFDPDLTGWALDRGVPMLPGAFTPTEVFAAWESGAPAVKVFPASVGGPDLIRSIGAPFPEIGLIPTGGVTADNAAAYLAAGAIAVGVGGWLTGDPDISLVIERASRLVDAIQLV